MGTFENLINERKTDNTPSNVAIADEQSPVTVAKQPNISQFSSSPEVKAPVKEEEKEEVKEEEVHSVTKGSHTAKVREELSSSYTHIVQCICHWTGRFRSKQDAIAAAQRHVDVRETLAGKNK